MKPKDENLLTGVEKVPSNPEPWIACAEPLDSQGRWICLRRKGHDGDHSPKAEYKPAPAAPPVLQSEPAGGDVERYECGATASKGSPLICPIHGKDCKTPERAFLEEYFHARWSGYQLKHLHDLTTAIRREAEQPLRVIESVSGDEFMEDLGLSTDLTEREKKAYEKLSLIYRVSHSHLPTTCHSAHEDWREEAR
jgi:hypothetical protein